MAYFKHHGLRLAEAPAEVIWIPTSLTDTAAYRFRKSFCLLSSASRSCPGAVTGLSPASESSLNSATGMVIAAVSWPLAYTQAAESRPAALDVDQSGDSMLGYAAKATDAERPSEEQWRFVFHGPVCPLWDVDAQPDEGVVLRRCYFDLIPRSAQDKCMAPGPILGAALDKSTT